MPQCEETPEGPYPGKLLGFALRKSRCSLKLSKWVFPDSSQQSEKRCNRWRRSVHKRQKVLGIVREVSYSHFELVGCMNSTRWQRFGLGEVRFKHNHLTQLTRDA